MEMKRMKEKKSRPTVTKIMNEFYKETLLQHQSDKNLQIKSSNFFPYKAAISPHKAAISPHKAVNCDWISVQSANKEWRV